MLSATLKQKLSLGIFMILGIFLIYTNSADAAIEVSGFISADETWSSENSPYILTGGGVAVVSGATLTIKPGVIVKFQEEAQLLNHSGHASGGGKIIANGTPDKHIIFTAYTDDSAGGDSNNDATLTSPTSGYWHRIVLANKDDSLIYNEIRYGKSCIDSFFANPTIKNNRIENCETALGATYASSTIVIENNTITQNYNGLSFLAPLGVVFRNNNIFDNQNMGAINLSGGDPPEYQVDGRNNWWGDASGPYNASENPSGQGDRISDGIIFRPWLQEKIDQNEPPSPKHNPVIIIPGMVGSELYSNEGLIWPNIGRMFDEIGDFFVIENLALDDQGLPEKTILAQDIIKKIDLSAFGLSSIP